MRTNDVLGQIDSTLGDWDVSGDAMRCTPAAGELPPPPLTVVITIDTTQITAALAYFREMREHLHAWAEAARPQIEETGRAFEKASEAMQRVSACDAHCKPPRPRDRPAWQSPYGPTRRRR